MKNFNKRVLASAVMLFLGFIIAMIPENTTRPYKLTGTDMVMEIQNGTEMILTDELADWLINKDPSIQLIDVRTPDEYDTFHLPGAINIPLNDLLSDEWTDILDQGTRMNILYSNGTTSAHNCWMVVRQLGYENNYVLQGGLNYWVETILNPDKPVVYSSDDEAAKYDFRKGAGQVFGGPMPSSDPADDQDSNKPKIIRKKKKKTPEGGC